MDNRREGEANYGKKLPPSERLLNVAKAVAVVIPLFSVGWFSNSETAREFYAEEKKSPDNIESAVPEAVIQDAPVAQAGIIERTIIREKDCGTSEAMKSHVKALH